MFSGIIAGKKDVKEKFQSLESANCKTECSNLCLNNIKILFLENDFLKLSFEELKLMQLYGVTNRDYDIH